MNRNVRLYLVGILFLFVIIVIVACGKKGDKNLASTPGELQRKVNEIVQQFAKANNNVDSSIRLKQPVISRLIYSNNSFESIWSQSQAWQTAGDSLFDFISHAQLFGLFPEDYHFEE